MPAILYTVDLAVTQHYTILHLPKSASLILNSLVNRILTMMNKHNISAITSGRSLHAVCEGRGTRLLGQHRKLVERAEKVVDTGT